MRATNAQVAQLAAGVTITTVAQSDGRAKPLTAPTLPCVVERDAAPTDQDAAPAGRPSANRSPAGRALRFVLREGRNRQIRRMCSALGLTVTELHRTGVLTPNLIPVPTLTPIPTPTPIPALTPIPTLTPTPTPTPTPNLTPTRTLPLPLPLTR